MNDVREIFPPHWCTAFAYLLKRALDSQEFNVIQKWVDVKISLSVVKWGKVCSAPIKILQVVLVCGPVETMNFSLYIHESTKELCPYS